MGSIIVYGEDLDGKTFRDRLKESIQHTINYYESLNYGLWLVEHINRTATASYSKGSTVSEALQDYFKHSPADLQTFNQTRISALPYQRVKTPYGGYRQNEIVFNRETLKVKPLGWVEETPLPEEYVLEMFFDKDVADWLKRSLKFAGPYVSLKRFITTNKFI